MDFATRVSRYTNLFGNWQVQQLLFDGGAAACSQFQLTRPGAYGLEHCRMYAACIVQRNFSWYILSPQQQQMQYQAADMEVQMTVQKLYQQHILPGGVMIPGSFEHAVSFWADDDSFGWDLLVRQIAPVAAPYGQPPIIAPQASAASVIPPSQQPCADFVSQEQVHPLQQASVSPAPQEPAYAIHQEPAYAAHQEPAYAMHQEPSYSASQQPDSYFIPESGKKSKKNKKKTAIIAGVLALVVAAGAAAGFFLLNDKDKGDAQIMGPSGGNHEDDSAGSDLEKAQAAIPGKVYWVDSGSVYHTDMDCVYLSNAIEINAGAVEFAFDDGHTHLCSRCAKRDGIDGILIVGKDDVPVPAQTTAAALPAQTTPEPAPTEPPVKTLTYAPGTLLRMATGYNNAKTGMVFDADVAREGIILADGRKYYAGDLKPTWVEMQNRLGINFENCYMGNYATKEFQYWQDRLGEVDMISVNLSAANEAGSYGQLVNLAEYLDYMPNFKAFLDANPVVRLSITADMNTGAIYAAPYFDGFEDVERLPLMRTDWVEKLLNGEGKFNASKSNKLSSPVYTPYMPTSGKIAVDVVEPDGHTVRTITKDYDVYGNIIDRMNAAGRISGEDAVNMLRDYIDYTYGGYYGTNRADLFIGQNAAWDADELVALLRCVVANPQSLNGTDHVEGLFARENDNNQRRVDMYRLAGTLFGVRGLDARYHWLYADQYGNIHDARQEEATYKALERMHAMAREGLISDSFINSADERTQTMLKEDKGFMQYDYSQTQVIYNETALQVDEGEAYRAVMIPVARWNDGTGDAYFRFTESWRSVKTDSWAISVDGVAGNQDKLHAALKIIDYAYSREGMILLSYGPDEFIMTDNRGNYQTFDFNGEQWPVIADATYDELLDKTGGNYTNYARYYLGGTMCFVKSQAFEYQCTHPVGRIGMGYISNAIACGIIRHPVMTPEGIDGNMWYASMPTVLPISDQNKETIYSMTDLGNVNFGTGRTQTNIFVDMIVSGYTVEGVSNASSAAGKVKNNWNGAAYLAIVQDAYDRYLEAYQYYCN